MPSSDRLDELLSTFTHTALRVEARQLYAIDEDADAIAAWKPGRPARPDFSVLTSQWAAQLALTSIAGKRWQRLRVVEMPVTPYTAWEVAAYQQSAVLGEEVRLLVSRDDYAMPAEDVWVFDAETDHPAAVVMNYDDEGRYVGNRVVGARVVHSYVQTTATAWADATPLAEFDPT